MAVESASVDDGLPLPFSLVFQDVGGAPGYETLANAYRFDECVTGDRLVLQLKAGPGGVVAVREIDVIVSSDEIASARMDRMFPDG